MSQQSIVFRGTGGLLAAALILGGFGSAQAADLVVTAFGGLWEQKYRECVVAEFERQTGKTVDVILGGPVQWQNQIAASPNDPPIDVLINTMDGAYAAVKQGIVDKIDPAKVPAVSELDPQFANTIDGYGPVYGYGALGLAFDKERVPDPPKTWSEFIDGTIAGKWTAAIPGIGYGSTPMTVIWLYAQLGGGGIDNIDPAIETIKKMKDSGHLILWNDVNQPLDMLKSGDIDMSMYWDTRTWAFYSAGNETIGYINPAPGAVVSPVVLQKVKNAPDLAWDFINVALSPGPQACWGNALQNGMSNKNVQYAPDVEPHITKLTEIVWPPFDKAPDKVSEWVERWNKEIGQ